MPAGAGDRDSDADKRVGSWRSRGSAGGRSCRGQDLSLLGRVSMILGSDRAGGRAFGDEKRV